MNEYPEKLEELLFLLRNLPGIGRRGAERLAMALLEWNQEKLSDLGKSIADLKINVVNCPVCGALTGKGESCRWCSDPRRDEKLLCVVESALQIYSIEKSNSYSGRYFVLGGKLSPLNGIGPDELRVKELDTLLEDGGVEEVILALGNDVEGRATAAFLSDHLKSRQLKITRPAAGLPAGANLSYADGATIAAALSGRTGC